MSFYSEFANGMARALVSAATETRSAREIAETCCDELGWSIDERFSVNELCLHFKDPVVGIRKVFVTIGDQDTTLTFEVRSAANRPLESIPLDVFGYLLVRNGKMVVAWQARQQIGGNVIFALKYCALAFGFHAAHFKFICESMANEALAFDTEMRKADLL